MSVFANPALRHDWVSKLKDAMGEDTKVLTIFDLEGDVHRFSYTRNRVKLAICQRQKPSYYPGQGWLSMVDTTATASVSAGYVLEDKRKIEKQVRTYISSLDEIINHFTYPETIAERVLSNPTMARDAAHVQPWVDAIASSKTIREVNINILYFGGAVVLRLLESSEFLALTPAQVDDGASVRGIVESFLKDKWSLAAAMKPLV